MSDAGPVRRALLLSGSIGMGHDVMAAALAGSLERRGWQTDTVDAMALLGGVGHRVGEAVFRSMLRVPGAFDALHFTALRSGGRVAEFLDKQAVARIVPRLDEVLTDRRTELAVGVFATGASAVARVKDRHPGLRSVTFCTDLNPHRMWVHRGTDVYLVTSATSAEFVLRFDPSAEVVVVPAPVRAQFYSAPSRSEARAGLGIPDVARCALLMAGAWGLGPLPDVARALARANVHTIAVAGRNTAVEERLRALAAADGRVVPFGFTDRVPELMAAADVVVTSAGDTCSEARVIGRRLVLLDVMAGHGRENLQHELEAGSAAVADTDPDLLVRRVLRTLDDTTPDPEPQTHRRDDWERGLDEVLRLVALH